MTVEKAMEATHSFFFFFFFDLLWWKQQFCWAGPGKSNKSTSVWSSRSDFYSYWHENRKTRKGEKQTPQRCLDLLFQHGCFTPKNLYQADREQRGRLSARPAQWWLETVCYYWIFIHSHLCQSNMNQFAQSTCCIFVYCCDALTRMNTRAHFLFTLVSPWGSTVRRRHFRVRQRRGAGQMRYHLQMKRINISYESGDCNYLSVFPQKFSFCFRDTGLVPDSCRLQNHFQNDAVILAWLTHGSLLCATLAPTLLWTAEWPLERVHFSHVYNSKRLLFFYENC